MHTKYKVLLRVYRLAYIYIDVLCTSLLIPFVSTPFVSNLVIFSVIFVRFRIFDPAIICCTNLESEIFSLQRCFLRIIEINPH